MIPQPARQDRVHDDVDDGQVPAPRNHQLFRPTLSNLHSPTHFLLYAASCCASGRRMTIAPSAFGSNFASTTLALPLRGLCQRSLTRPVDGADVLELDEVTWEERRATDLLRAGGC